MRNLWLNDGISRLSYTKSSLCLICKQNTEMVNHHIIDCPVFNDNHSSLQSNLKTKIINCNQTVEEDIDFVLNCEKLHVLTTQDKNRNVL